MKRRTKWTLVLIAGGLPGLILAGRLFLPTRQAPDPSPPSLEQIRELADLVVLRADVVSYQHTRIEGFTGGIELMMEVHGEVEVGCDLAHAKLKGVDSKAHCATIGLPKPRIRSARLDHAKTRVLRLERTGLWVLVPSSAGEAMLVERSMEQAQRALSQAADEAELIGRARDHTAHVLDGFADGIDWQLHVVWEGR